MKGLFILAMAAIAIVRGSGRVLSQQGSNVRFCIHEEVDAEWIAACNTAISAADTTSLSFSCVPGGSPDMCISMISQGKADLVNLGASDMPQAVEQGLVPIVAEFYGVDALTEYSAVAVVKESFCTSDVSLKDLKGVRSCHTGFRKTSGWNVPVGYLVSAGIIPVVSNNAVVTDDAESVASFFSKTCAPRVTSDGPGVGGTKYAGLCTACSGDCGTDGEPYYDYAGSIRGLMEDACDVSFTKETIPGTYAADGSDPQTWSTLDLDDMRLLCPDGGCAKVSDYKDCNLGRVPAHAVMALSTNPELNSIKDALVLAGNNPTFLPSVTELNGVENVPFKKGTEALLRVDMSFEKFYDPKVLAAFNQVRNLETQ
jgi:melanoma-associated antigen p97